MEQGILRRAGPVDVEGRNGCEYQKRLQPLICFQTASLVTPS
jgi:hypothetical protein